LDLVRLDDYLRNALSDPDLPADNAGWSRRLCGMGFMMERDGAAPVCSIAGLLLFGYRPRRLLRQAGVRWMVFNGRDKTARALDDKILDGPLVGLWRLRNGSRERDADGLMEQLIDRMQPFVSDEDTEVGIELRRERHWHYPPAALREAVVNAFAHRDWTRAEEIELCAYSDRLEITSPGALQNSMTVEKMIAGQRSPRNPLLIEVLRDYGYVDARGMGVRTRIIPLLTQQNGVPPAFTATEDYLRVTMFRGRPSGRSTPAGGGEGRPAGDTRDGRDV
jgi:ATP-dependent DNA helicase RecG